MLYCTVLYLAGQKVLYEAPGHCDPGPAVHLRYVRHADRDRLRLAPALDMGQHGHYGASNQTLRNITGLPSNKFNYKGCP